VTSSSRRMEVGERLARLLVGDWQAASNRSFNGEFIEDGAREIGRGSDLCWGELCGVR